MFTDQIQVFSGQVSNMSADLYLRLAEPPEQWKQVEVMGPYCTSGRTLPTTARFEPLQDTSGLWRARIIDPACWTLDHPMLYRVRLEAAAGHSEAKSIQIECGIRRFGCRDRNLWWDGKRWVLRGVMVNHVRETEFAAWKNARVAMWITDSQLTLLEEAARLGLMLVIDLRREIPAEELNRIARCPAVMMVIVDHNLEITSLRGLLPGIVLAKRFAPTTMPQPSEDADAVLLCVDAELPPDLTSLGNRPVLALRELSEPVDEIAAARSACDQLQRDLAGRYDLSGYIV